MDNGPALLQRSHLTPAIQKNRKNDTCDMKAWYYQTETDTFAFGSLVGAHGIRENLPADRTYYIVSGEGIFSVDNANMPVTKGSIIRISKGSTYDFHSTGDDPVEFFVDIGLRIDIDAIPTK